VQDRPAKCLILAAGTGQRMKSFKPLLNVAGLPLIERVIVTAHEAGISDFFVVTGNQAERLETFLGELARRRRLRITCIRNLDWRADNGVSLLQGETLLADDEFILLMGDHIVEEGLIETVLQEPLGDCDVALAVDSGVDANRMVDLDDVTRVMVRRDRVVAIGKGITEFNAFDTGVFRCRPSVFAAARACARYAARRGARGAGVVREPWQASRWIGFDGSEPSAVHPPADAFTPAAAKQHHT